MACHQSRASPVRRLERFLAWPSWACLRSRPQPLRVELRRIAQLVDEGYATVVDGPREVSVLFPGLVVGLSRTKWEEKSFLAVKAPRALWARQAAGELQVARQAAEEYRDRSDQGLNHGTEWQLL